MRLSLLRRLLLFCAALLCACRPEQASGTVTQVMVEIDADETVKMLTHSLRVRVEGGDAEAKPSERTVRLEETVNPIAFPKRVALVPLEGARAPRVFVLTATALDENGDYLAEARIISGYVSGQIRYARLMIEGNTCLRVRCEEAESTCSGGSCSVAQVDVTTFSEEPEEPTTVTFQPVAGSRDAEAEPSSETGVMEGGADPTPDEAGLSDAVFVLGAPCSKGGALGCAAHDSVVTLLCADGVWKESLRCRTGERCDTRLGSSQGQCLTLVAECAERPPLAPFCRGNRRLLCGPDRVTDDGVSCPAGEVCVETGGETACAADPDECALGTDSCDDQPEACRNTFGSYSCACPSGYTGTGQGPNGCVDVDECAPGMGSACGPGASACENTPGSYRCACRSGYTGTGTRSCVDLDECARGAVSACGAGATGCSNTSGSHSCTCGVGYRGTGTTACVPAVALGGRCSAASDCQSCNPSTAAVSCTNDICSCGNGAACSANDQCAGTCVRGRCVSADMTCDADDDCRGGKRCIGASSGAAGTCYLPEQSPCSSNAQCQGTCRPPDDEEGSSARFCLPLGGRESHCDENRDCESGYVCRATTALGFHCEVPARAMEACDESADCMSPLACVTIVAGSRFCQ